MRRRYIVAGGRDFDDYPRLDGILRSSLRPGDEVISGMAPGADTLAVTWAEQQRRHVSLKEMPADWRQYGRGAGMLRNAQMAEIGHVLISFWDGESKGTKGMIDLALKRGLEVHVYHY